MTATAVQPTNGNNGSASASTPIRDSHLSTMWLPDQQAGLFDPAAVAVPLPPDAMLQRPFQRTTDKVALVGFGPSTRDQAPFDDPSWEIWTLNESHVWLGQRRATRWFEMHTHEVLARKVRHEDHAGWLARAQLPIYMAERFEEIPYSVAFPLDAVARRFGRYFTSSLGYMTALAMAMGFTTIGVWGVDMANDTEYHEQRPNFEYLLGWARGLGINVVLPEEACLLKSGTLYGYQTDQSPINRDTLEARSDQVRAQLNELRLQVARAEGREEELAAMLFGLALHERGSPVSWGSDLPQPKSATFRVGGVRGIVTPTPPSTPSPSAHPIAPK